MKRIKTISALILILSFATSSYAQVQFTRNGKISFFSTTPVEDIKAENNEVVSFLDPQKGEMRFQVLIKGFVFPKATMQEHFNGKDYMNSDQFPQAKFTGNITNLKDVNFAKDGSYKVTVKGSLTMHGVTKPVEAYGTITIAGGLASAKAVFRVNREDYGITVPSFASSKIAKDIEITVDCKYGKYK